MDAQRAVAEAWASIDGRLEEFIAGENVPLTSPESDGHFDGYMAEARELISRIEKRGYVIVRRPRGFGVAMALARAMGKQWQT